MPPRPAAAHADIDESIRESPPGHYVLAAAIVDDDQADVLRHMLRSLIPRRAARFHWHEVPAANQPQRELTHRHQADRRHQWKRRTDRQPDHAPNLQPHHEDQLRKITRPCGASGLSAPGASIVRFP